MMPLKNKRVFRSGHSNSCLPGAGRKIAGFGLVEVMVASLLGAILVGTVFQSYVSTRVSYGITEGMSRLQENYRYAMAHMDRNFRSGGHAGCLEAVGNNMENLLGIQTGLYNFGRPVFGTEGGASPDNITVIRGIGSAFTPMEGKIQAHDDGNTGQAFSVNAATGVAIGLQQYQVVTLSNCADAVTFMITNDPSGGTIRHDLGIVSPGPLNTGQFNQKITMIAGDFGDEDHGPVGYASDLY
jgi:type IV pilus assembly protein PilW